MNSALPVQQQQPGSYGPPQPQHQQQSYSSTSMTSPASSDPAGLLLHHFPEAAKLSREDLDEMLRSPPYFDAFFGTQPQTLALYKEHEDLLRRNQALTDQNMALRERHEALKAETQAAFNDARSLQRKWHEQLVPAQAEAHKRFTSNVQLARLRTAAYDQNRLSEHLVSSLAEGTLNPDDFAKQFKEVRKVYYRRNGQVEKFQAGHVEWQDQ